jgi:transposase-like protein
MKATARQEKFNEFRKLTQESTLSSIAISEQIGISKNTVYNWRKRLRLEIQASQSSSSQVSPPLFTRVVVQPGPHSQPSSSACIEITVGNNIVFRVPDLPSQAALQTILDSISQWSQQR